MKLVVMEEFEKEFADFAKPFYSRLASEFGPYIGYTQLAIRHHADKNSVFSPAVDIVFRRYTEYQKIVEILE